MRLLVSRARTWKNEHSQDHDASSTFDEKMSGRKSTRATMIDVARACGHSVSTVDRVLNGRSNVRAETAMEIRDAAEALGYRAAGVLRERVRTVTPRLTLGHLLLQPDQAIYRDLAAELVSATQGRADMRGRAVVEHLRSQSPDAVAEHLRDLGRRVDALAIVAADHPVVHEAIAEVAAGGVPVFTLMSDVDAPARAGHVGLDNRRVGRTAAWFLTHLARRPGPLATFIGTHRFQCQELCEMSFRAYVREHAEGFELLETRVTLESAEHAEEAMRDLLARHDELAGFYVGGGGIEGCLRALEGIAPGQRPLGVAHDLTAVTRQALLRGPLCAVLSHPLVAMCAALVEQMRAELAEPAAGLRQVLLPLVITVPEST